MMCLGWYNRPTCAAREQVEITPGLTPGEQAQIAAGVEPCPNILWFWLSAAAIILTGSMKR